MRIARALWGLRSWKRHDLILMVAGFIYTLVGMSYVFAETTESRFVALKVLIEVAPLHFWGGVFIFAGILAIISSKWPPFAETWGYVVLTGISSGWGATYLVGIIFSGSPWSNISGALLWGLLGFMWWAISGLLNPDKTVVTHGDGPD